MLLKVVGSGRVRSPPPFNSVNYYFSFFFKFFFESLATSGQKQDLNSVSIRLFISLFLFLLFVSFCFFFFFLLRLGSEFSGKLL